MVNQVVIRRDSFACKETGANHIVRRVIEVLCLVTNDGKLLGSGTLRLILRNGRVEVHYAVESDECCTKPCGLKEVGGL